jgi:GNAT superfamily N-acetyltransferase
MGLSSLPLPDPVVRLAVESDRADLDRLLRGARAELDGRKGAWLWERANARWPSIESAVSEVLTPPWIVAVGTFDEAIVGLCLGVIDVMHSDGSIGVVHGLYVEPDGRAVSVGDALIGWMVETFRAADCVGVDAWALPGERDTKNFYEAHAFSARLITVHHSFIGPTHVSRTDAIRAGMVASEGSEEPDSGDEDQT